MDLRHLQTFVVAYECQNFTRAAERLGLTQAAVSKHIAVLEDDLGAELFDRQGRSMVATPAAATLYAYACKILDLVDQARSDVDQRVKSLVGRVRLALSTVPAECLLPELLKQFHQLQPEIEVSISISDSVEAASDVARGRADVGLVGEAPSADELDATPIADDELILVVPPGHPWAEKKYVTVKQLCTEPLIVREEGSGSRHCVEQQIVAAGARPSDLKIAVEMNSNEAIRSAVRGGLGVAFQSRDVVQVDIAAGNLAAVPIRGFHVTRKLYAVTSHRRRPSQAARAFMDFLTKRKVRAT